MNQILMTESNNTKNKIHKIPKEYRDPNDISGIIKIFAILIMIFGIALFSDGVYAIVQNAETTKNTKLPVVEVLKVGNTAKLSISCENGIRTISYAWNDSTDTIVQGRGNTLIEQSIQIPSGENRLNITVIDSKGQTRRYVKNLKQDEIDTTEPSINFEVVNSSIKIIVTDDTAIDYMTYKYGDNQEVIVRAQQEGQTIIEETIAVTQGENTITVEAVDKAQNVATISQKVKGAKKPTIEVIPDPNDASYIIIKAYDDEGLRMIAYSINGKEYTTDPNTSLNSKTFEWKQKVESGRSNIIIHAYNVNEQVAEFNGVYDY